MKEKRIEGDYKPSTGGSQYMQNEFSGPTLETRAKRMVLSVGEAVRNNIEQVNTLTSMVVFGLRSGYIKL